MGRDISKSGLLIHGSLQQFQLPITTDIKQNPESHLTSYKRSLTFLQFPVRAVRESNGTQNENTSKIVCEKFVFRLCVGAFVQQIMMNFGTVRDLTYGQSIVQTIVLIGSSFGPIQRVNAGVSHNKSQWPLYLCTA